MMKIPKKWIDIEMEHTKSRKVARRIVGQHLAEYKDYYPALIKMEKMLEKRKVKK
jgi:hypothetical protein